MSEGETEREFFVGPPQEPWWKFKLAALVWKLTRGNRLPAVGYIPKANRAAKWAFKMRVMSRDFTEVSDDSK